MTAHSNSARCSGYVFDVKRFSIHDGPGIRTTVFLKGCPLRCLWCDNPESQHTEPEIVFWRERCIGCEACLGSCTRGAIRVGVQGRKLVLSERCNLCGRCIDVCYAQALEQIGRLRTAEEIVSMVKDDLPFYEESGGGVTLSGGEPAAQPAFSRRILEGCQAHGINTAIETSGHAAWAVWKELLPHLDLILYDVKEVNPARHKRFTGLSNELILNNLERIAAVGKHVIVRRPIIPGYNDDPDSIHALARVVGELNGIDEIHLLPFHRLGESKYRQLDREWTLRDKPSPASEKVENLRDILIRYGFQVNIGG